MFGSKEDIKSRKKPHYNTDHHRGLSWAGNHQVPAMQEPQPWNSIRLKTKKFFYKRLSTELDALHRYWTEKLLPFYSDTHHDANTGSDTTNIDDQMYIFRYRP